MRTVASEVKVVTTAVRINHEYWMREAYVLACEAKRVGEVPVGAIVVYDGQIIGKGFNQPISSYDPSAHAEIVAMRDAANHLQNYRLLDTTLYVTLEPCVMCAGAMVHARIKNLVFGASDLRAGAVCTVFNILDESALNHRVEWVGGILKDECGEILKNFFKARR